MLPKKARLNRREFDTCFAQGRRHHSSTLTIIVYPQPEFKAAVVVSKKVAKKAHDRNRLRRRVYAQLKTATLQSGWWVVVTKPTLARLSHKEQMKVVHEEIARVLNNQ